MENQVYSRIKKNKNPACWKLEEGMEHKAKRVPIDDQSIKLFVGRSGHQLDVLVRMAGTIVFEADIRIILGEWIRDGRI